VSAQRPLSSREELIGRDAPVAQCCAKAWRKIAPNNGHQLGEISDFKQSSRIRRRGA
jgi:hypothetical protein